MKDDAVKRAVRELFAEPEAWLAADHGVSGKVRTSLTEFLRRTDRPGSAPLEQAQADFLETRIPDEPSAPDAYFDFLLDDIVPAAVKTGAPQFIGHMTSALPGYVHGISKIVSALNQNVVKVETSGVLTLYERQALAMLHRLVYGAGPSFYETHAQRNESTLGMMVSGGTLGNVAALWCARNKLLGFQGEIPGVAATGLRAALMHHDFGGAVLIGSKLMHYSIDKAADILGIGEQGIVRLPVDAEGRVVVTAAAEAIAAARARRECVVALIGVAGSTEVGSIDRLGELADLAERAGVHLHVDAAWGGPVLFSERHRQKLAGIERADSVTIDGHKQLYLPVGIGTVLFRDPELAKHVEKIANYVVRAPSRDLGKRSLEGTRPGLSVFVHAALTIIGRRGFAYLIDEGIAKTAYLARAVRARPQLELLGEPELNILVYRYLPASERARLGRRGADGPRHARINEVNRRLQERQFAEGEGFVSRTLLTSTPYGPEPVVALRVVLSNPMTTEADIDAVLDEQLALGARIERELEQEVLA